MKTSRIIGVVVISVVGLFIIMAIFMGIFLRRNNMTLRDFVTERLAAKKEAESQLLTDSSFTPVTGMNKIKLPSGDKMRTGLIYIPTSYNPTQATPLVIGYHGGFGQGENQEKLTHMSEVADKEGFIIAYPDGLGRHWNDGRKFAADASHGTDDVQFTRDLIAAISSRLNIDAKRIYATGISNGGMMSYRVGCEMTDTFAAIAPVSSGLPIDLQNICKPTGPIPVLIMQGTADPLIPFNGGQITHDIGEVLPTRDTIAYWVANNRANTEPTTTQIPNTTDDGTSITHESYGADNTNAAPVEVYIIENGGHTWAGGNQYAREARIGKTSRDVDASMLIWEFFKQHSR